MTISDNFSINAVQALSKYAAVGHSYLFDKQQSGAVACLAKYTFVLYGLNWLHAHLIINREIKKLITSNDASKIAAFVKKYPYFGSVTFFL